MRKYRTVKTKTPCYHCKNAVLPKSKAGWCKMQGYQEYFKGTSKISCKDFK